MSYTIKPNYHFKTKNDIGIDEIPVGRIVVVENYDNSIRTFVKTGNDGLTASSTIEDANNASLLLSMGGGATQAHMMAYN